MRNKRNSIVSMQSSLPSINEEEDIDSNRVQATRSQVSLFSQSSLSSAKSSVSWTSSGEDEAVSVASVENFGHDRQNKLVKIADAFVRKRSLSVQIDEDQQDRSVEPKYAGRVNHNDSP